MKSVNQGMFGGRRRMKCVRVEQRGTRTRSAWASSSGHASLASLSSNAASRTYSLPPVAMSLCHMSLSYKMDAGRHHGRTAFQIPNMRSISEREVSRNRSAYLRSSSTCGERGAAAKYNGRRSLACKAIFGGWNPLKSDPAESTRKMYQGAVDMSLQYMEQFRSLSDEELRSKTEELRSRVRGGELLEDLLPEAFAVVSEASSRVIGLRPYDVQLIGGMVLHDGKVAEMKTGEGKTLVAVLPAFLNALEGKGVHVVTVNDYLAKRDAEWVGQVHRFLGLSVGLIQQTMTPDERRKAYNSDVTYVTNSELGFDYLRDNLAALPEELVLRDFNFCIIDEVDSILIDEARTPLIISGEAEPAGNKYLTAAKIANAFERDIHYTVQEKEQSASLTEEGFESAEEVLQVSDLYDPREQWAAYIINAIIAKELKKKDKHYIMRNNEVIIVDEFTGRTMPGRRWSNGLHQAIEAKEEAPIQKETTTVASISYQNFFMTFPKLAGMTGTAATEIKEFGDIYNLPVDVVPTNKELVRKDNPDVVFKTETYKWAAVRKEIQYMHDIGRPILIGTTTVEQSESLSEDLTKLDIPHRVLNAKPENVQKESETVAQGGRMRAVTIATNMAGRGTDILLGGNPEFMARLKIREILFPRIVKDDEQDNQIAFEPGKKKVPQKAAKDWSCDPLLFPCELSSDVQDAINDAVTKALSVYGEKSLSELEIEDILSTSCERAPTEDGVILSLRKAFLSCVDCYEEVTRKEKEKVISKGGLHVIGTERHESRRIDNQLRGRSGRQGDPGSTRFFLSLNDRLFKVFGGDRVKNIMEAFGLDDVPLESDMVSKSLDDAQKKVEQFYFDARKSMYDYDKVMNLQRSKLYSERRKILLTENLQPTLKDFAERTITDIVDYHLPVDSPITDEALSNLCQKVTEYCQFLADVTPESLKDSCTSAGVTLVDNAKSREKMLAVLQSRAVDAVSVKLEEINAISPPSSSSSLSSEAARHLCLLHFDETWKKVLQAMSFLQTSVRLRGYAQKDPLIEYKLQGFTVFSESMMQARRNIVYSWYKFDAQKVLTWREEQKQLETSSNSTEMDAKKRKKKKQVLTT